MERNNILNKCMRDYSKSMDILQLLLICIGALIVPTFLANFLTSIFGQGSWISSHSQIIVGSIVNVALIVTAINVRGFKKIAVIVTLPSISAILGGYVFKSASSYMVYMIPSIWLGNFALVYLYKLLLLNKNFNYFFTAIVAITVKVGIIFLGFNVLNVFGFFPAKLVQNLQNAMGITQALTATIGMFISYSVYLANKKPL